MAKADTSQRKRPLRCRFGFHRWRLVDHRDRFGYLCTREGCGRRTDLP